MRSVKSQKSKVILIIAIVLVVIFSALVSFKVFDVLPSWNEIFNFFGISDISSKADGYDLAVQYMSVGKADAMLIECNGKNMLIDSGNVDPSNTVVEYLKKRNIKDLDLVIATHPDKDHIGGMANVVYEFNINRFMMPEIPEKLIPKSSAYEGMVYALNAKGIIVENPTPGDRFEFGGAEGLILGPVKQYDDSTNNNSIVMRLAYGNDSFLFTGDAEKEEEADIISQGYDLKTTVLKLGHHGSKTSTSEAFLKAVAPQYAVISVGEDDNNLPKKIILDRLSENGVRFYRTDLNGTVVMTSNGTGITVFTQK